ncbi:hypothetical protein KP509_13G075200 [Ceratopteris richardii]|uniref:RING-type E3 ubiquitin transferase n=1 Tax=Ceratopteris richardii TaxID=49495 RepID=A0A8T2TEP3_CERRI|nr:hypothetical protein KP509_13G075200 [Ceratopteris richardii]
MTIIFKVISLSLCSLHSNAALLWKRALSMLAMYCPSYCIIIIFHLLHSGEILGVAGMSSSAARRILLQSSSPLNPPQLSGPIPQPETVTVDISPLAYTCRSFCNHSFVTHSKALNISVLVVFIACVVMSLVSVYIRRYCLQDINVREGQGVDRFHDVREVNKTWMQALPVKKYGMGGAKADDKVECAVCLSEFEAGELLKLFPICGHVFHQDCIDMWLSSHLTCPVCRLSLIKQNANPDPDPSAQRSRRAIESFSILASIHHSLHAAEAT